MKGLFVLNNLTPEWNEALQVSVLCCAVSHRLLPGLHHELLRSRQDGFQEKLSGNRAAWRDDTWQLVIPGKEKSSTAVLLFGKVRRDEYALDFRHPLSCLQVRPPPRKLAMKFLRPSSSSSPILVTGLVSREDKVPSIPDA